MDADLDVRVHRTENVPVVSLSGDVDSYTCDKLRETIIELLSQGDSRVVISMGRVNYIDSAGLGTLVGGLRRVHERDGGLAISNASPQIRRVLSITGLSKVFDVYETDVEAARSLQRDKIKD